MACSAIFFFSNFKVFNIYILMHQELTYFMYIVRKQLSFFNMGNQVSQASYIVTHHFPYDHCHSEKN